MNRFKFFGLAAVAGICFAVAIPKTQAQVSIEIGAAPQCPYGYYDVALTAHPTDTMVRSGSPAARSLGSARGFMAVKVSAVT